MLKTEILSENKKEDIARAGEIINSGGLVAMPTETVYGLAANALEPSAVSKIYLAKGRPSDNPLIVHISDISQLEELVSELPQTAVLLAKKFWPGPLTMILSKTSKVPKETSGGLSTVAVRLPANETATSIIEAAGVPLAAPSANTSGRPSPTTFEHVYNDLNGKVEAIVKGKASAVGLESTIVSLIGKPRLLRPGGITLAQLEEAIGEIEVDSAVLEQMDENAKVRSPGMKYTHYSPKANITLIDASPDEFISYANEKGDFVLCFDEDKDKLTVPCVSYGSRYSSQEQAKRLFSALHELDEKKAKNVLAIMPRKTGVGLAVYNRLIRAAGFQVVNPNNHMIVGMCGVTGAGKTTVGKIFEDYGCAVVDCDEVSRRPDVYDSECIRELQAEFGEDIAVEGRLDRRLLAKRAFASEKGKTRLNQITHPRIIAKCNEVISEMEMSGKRVIILDAPTLFEAGLDRECARIITVTAPEELRVERIMQRDGISKELAMARVKAQHDESFFTERADYVIDASGKLGLEIQVAPIAKELLKAAGEVNA